MRTILLFFEAVNRALKIGGIFCLEIVHRESYVKNMLPQEWRESEQYIILKEQTINFETSRYVRKTIYIDKRNNKRSERYSSARIFTIYEVNDWLKKAGFKILRCFDGLKPNDFVPELSEQLCVIAIKEHELPGGYGVKERRGYSKNRTLKQAIEK